LQTRDNIFASGLTYDLKSINTSGIFSFRWICRNAKRSLQRCGFNLNITTEYFWCCCICSCCFRRSMKTSLACQAWMWKLRPLLMLLA